MISEMTVERAATSRLVRRSRRTWGSLNACEYHCVVNPFQLIRFGSLSTLNTITATIGAYRQTSTRPVNTEVMRGRRSPHATAASAL